MIPCQHIDKKEGGLRRWDVQKYFAFGFKSWDFQTGVWTHIKAYISDLMWFINDETKILVGKMFLFILSEVRKLRS